MGSQVGDNAWAKALTYINGTAVVPTTSPTATVSPTASPTATVTVSPTISPTATVSPITSPTATVSPTATATPVLAEVQAAVADLSAGIREQVSAGQLPSYSGSDLQGKVDKIDAYASAGDWDTARYYASQVRIKLGKYLDSGTITLTGYQALIPLVDAVDATMA